MHPKFADVFMGDGNAPFLIPCVIWNGMYFVSLEPDRDNRSEFSITGQDVAVGNVSGHQDGFVIVQSYSQTNGLIGNETDGPVVYIDPSRLAYIKLSTD